MIAALVDASNDDLHVEFAPSFLLDLEWRLLYNYRTSDESVIVPSSLVIDGQTLSFSIAKCGVQFIGHFLEDGRWHVVTLIVDEHYSNVPRPHRIFN